MTGQPMVCAYCGALKPWLVANFPVYYYAKCADCYRKEPTRGRKM